MNRKTLSLLLALFGALCLLTASLIIAAVEMQRRADGEIGRLQSQLCVFKHARNMAIIGDGFANNTVMYHDFVKMWREERARYTSECVDRPV